MILVEFLSRRRVFVKRVASVCGIILAAPLAGCGSQGIDYGDSGPKPSARRATLSVPIPSEPVYGHADSRNVSGRAPYATASKNGYYQEASVQRGALAPLGANSDEGAPIGGSYAMQPVVEDGGAGVSKPTYPSSQRYAGSAQRNYEGSPSAYQPRYDQYKPYRGEERSARPLYGDRTGSTHAGEYTVAVGDTLYSIAQRHGMSTGELAELNRIDGATIHPGQRLRVRGGGQDYTSASRYKPSPNYEPRYEDRGEERYSGQDRKAPPPGYYESNGDNGSVREGKSKPPYARKGSDYAAGEADEGDRPPYAKRYGGTPQSYGDKSPAYGDKPSYTEKPSYGEKPSYAEKPWRGDKSEGRTASRYEEPRDDTREPRYAPHSQKPKGSYHAYTVRRGDTLLEVARRTGIAPRELADYNDISASAALYPGQVLHIPKRKGDGWDGARDDAEGRDDDQDERYAPPRSEQEGYAPRTPYSQKAPAAEERRVAKASPAPGERPAASDASAAPQPTAAPANRNGGQPILAANRDLAGEPGGQQPSAQDCESLLANPATRSAQTFREPVQGVITAKFGSRGDGSFNDGIDFSVPKGTPVKAAENGVVAYAGSELPGFGNLVLVRHADGYVTAYAHNEEVLVRRCDVVKRGQIISKAGATGKVSQPQLHFELRKDSKPIDPEAFFSRS